MSRNLTIKDLPVYFDVDGVKVKVGYDKETDEVFGETDSGTPYPMIKAQAEGSEITKEEFERGQS